MAKSGGLGDQFFIGGFDLSGDVASLDTISGPSDVFEWTTIKQFAHERGLGLRSCAMSFTSLFEKAATVSTPGVPANNTPLVSTINQLVYVQITGGTMTNVVINGVSVGTGAGLYSLPRLGTITLTYTVAPTWTWFSLGFEHDALATEQGGADTIATYAHGSALGSVAACSQVLQTDYDPTRDNTGNITLKVDLTCDKFGMEWGVQATPGIRSDVAATNGTSFDNGASTAFGAQAYLQLFKLIGTNVDVNLQHSADNASWSTLIDFGSLTTAPQSLRGFVSNVTTVNRWLRVITTGTFSLAMFNVVVNRNPIAGVGF